MGDFLMVNNIESFFFHQPSSVHGWTSAFLLAVHRLCGVIEGRLSHFLPRWLRTGWQSAISQGKIPWNTPPWLGIFQGIFPWLIIESGEVKSIPNSMKSGEDNSMPHSMESILCPIAQRIIRCLIVSPLCSHYLQWDLHYSYCGNPKPRQHIGDERIAQN